MSDMTLSVNGHRRLAELALRQTFGEDTSEGPKCATPAPLLDVLAQWPGHPEDPLDVALHLPVSRNIEREAAGSPAVVLRVNRMTVLHNGRKIGYALRTNEAGLNAIAVYEAAIRRLRQAH